MFRVARSLVLVVIMVSTCWSQSALCASNKPVFVLSDEYAEQISTPCTSVDFPTDSATFCTVLNYTVVEQGSAAAFRQLDFQAQTFADQLSNTWVTGNKLVTQQCRIDLQVYACTSAFMGCGSSATQTGAAKNGTEPRRLRPCRSLCERHCDSCYLDGDNALCPCSSLPATNCLSATDLNIPALAELPFTPSNAAARQVAAAPFTLFLALLVSVVAALLGPVP